MRAVDINTVVVVSVGTLARGFRRRLGLQPCARWIAVSERFRGRDERPTRDLLETILSWPTSTGMNVYLGSLQTATDWTDGTEFGALRSYN